MDTNNSTNIVNMNFLSIDCSTDIGSLFVKIESKTFIKVLQSDKFDNDLLMSEIIVFLTANKVKFNDLSKIFVNQGPGNFSGLRGSLAVAKGISIAKSINLFGYNTFLWSCAEYLNKRELIYSIINLRKKYFIKKFDKNLNNSIKVKEILIDEIIEKYGNELKVIPKNMVKFFDKKLLNLKNLKIVDLDHKVLEFLELKGLLDTKLIKPIYLS
jgi:tRNA threonylcarbamoyladenosine biosynthesis protein TsaB